MKQQQKKSTHPNHPISAMIIIDPTRARREILGHLRRVGMHRGEAATAIGCAYSTLLRWIRDLDLEGEILQLEKRAVRDGWYHGRVGGRPIGSTVANGAAPRGSLQAHNGATARRKARAIVKGQRRARAV